MHISKMCSSIYFDSCKYPVDISIIPQSFLLLLCNPAPPLLFPDNSFPAVTID